MNTGKFGTWTCSSPGLTNATATARFCTRLATRVKRLFVRDDPTTSPASLRTYAVTIAAVAFAALIRWLLQPLLKDGAFLSTFTVAVIVCAWFGGLRSAGLAMVLGFIAGWFLFILPHAREVNFSFSYLSRYGMYFVVCSTVAVFGEAMRRAQEQSKKSEHLAQQKADTLRITFASIADGVITTDDTGNITYVNAVAEILTGWRNDEAMNHPLREVFAIVDERTRQVVENPVRKVLQEGRAVGPANRTILIARDGSEKSIDESAAPIIDDHGKLRGVIVVFRDTTERKHAEIAVRDSEKRFRQLADAMPQIVWTARPDGNIDYQNRQWFEFVDDPKSSGNEAWSQIVHPDDAPIARGRWETSVKTGSRFEMEIRLMDRRSKSYRWHLIRTVAVFDDSGKVTRWFGTGTDIHEQKQAEQKSRYLAEASALLADVVDYEKTLQQVVNLAVPYFADWSAVDVANENGSLRRLVVAHRDPAKCRLAREIGERYPKDPQASQGVGAVFRTGTPALVGEVTDEMLVKEAQDERHLELIRSLGLKSYICVPLIASSHALGALTFATAESERRYTEPDLVLALDLAHRAAVAIENTRLYQALRDADRRKDEFLATLAHELRNPLAPIRNSLQILNMPQVDPSTSQQVREVMERQIHHHVRIVDDLLDVSRVMRGKIELRKETVELATIVARAVETVGPMIEIQQHRLELSLPDEPLVTHADPVRLTQVIGNLLTNAAKYTEAHGQIRLSAERDHETAVIRVRDSGIGIAPEMLPHILELFVQVDHTTTRSQGGLGIGLTLVRNLIEMHGGTVHAESAGLGKGSEFVVRLPLVAVEQPDPH